MESKRSDKTDFAEQLGAMNKSWQLLQGRVGEKVSWVVCPSDMDADPENSLSVGRKPFHKGCG